MTNIRDTIVAVSSPPGRSPRGLVRLSGPGVMGVVGDLLATPQTPVEGLRAWSQPRRLIPCKLHLPATDHRSTLALPATVTVFPSPHSYTGQDMAEILCPGNPALLDRLVHRTVALGARPAEAGEFTFRAFLAGKMDLTQAEGVAATIAAGSETHLRAAAMLREGQLGKLASEMVESLAGQLALVEAGIDFTDQEDVVPIPPAALDDTLARVGDRLDHTLRHSRSWGAVEALPRVVLVGPPNAGKSTLFNTLLARGRAVISPFANTTRDVLAEPVMLTDAAGRCCEVMLIDIAGLDSPRTALDQQAQAAARSAIDRADLILAISSHDPPLQHPAGDTPVIRVRSKADLIDLASKTTSLNAIDVAVSAHTGTGIDQLRQMIVDRLAARSASVSGQMLALQPRHEAALRQALAHLRKTREILETQRGNRALDRVDLVASTLRQAMDELAGLGGRMTSEDILGRVFSTFCIGK